MEQEATLLKEGRETAPELLQVARELKTTAELARRFIQCVHARARKQGGLKGCSTPKFGCLLVNYRAYEAGGVARGVFRTLRNRGIDPHAHKVGGSLDLRTSWVFPLPGDVPELSSLQPLVDLLMSKALDDKEEDDFN